MSRRTRAPYAVLRVAALILHRAGYSPAQITAHLRSTAPPAEPDPVARDLLDAAVRHLAELGFTYSEVLGVRDAVRRLRAELGGTSASAQPGQADPDQPGLFETEAT